MPRCCRSSAAPASPTPSGRILLDERDALAVGCAKLNTQTRERCVTGEKPIELARLYARSQQVGQGVGAGLLEACFGEARALGHDVIWLGVWGRRAR